jgi:RHS repeat-associated protein
VITQTDKLFTGQRSEPADEGLGLYNYRARFTSTTTGRFLSADPITPGTMDPQGLNRYAYVRGNPVRFTDPSGHCWAPGSQFCSGRDPGCDLACQVRRATRPHPTRRSSGGAATPEPNVNPDPDVNPEPSGDPGRRPYSQTNAPTQAPFDDTCLGMFRAAEMAPYTVTTWADVVCGPLPTSIILKIRVYDEGPPAGVLLQVYWRGCWGFYCRTSGTFRDLSVGRFYFFVDLFCGNCIPQVAHYFVGVLRVWGEFPHV